MNYEISIYNTFFEKYRCIYVLLVLISSFFKTAVFWKYMFVFWVCCVLWIVILNAFIGFGVFSVYIWTGFKDIVLHFRKMSQKCEPFSYELSVREIVSFDPKWSPLPTHTPHHPNPRRQCQSSLPGNKYGNKQNFIDFIWLSWFFF